MLRVRSLSGRVNLGLREIGHSLITRAVLVTATILLVAAAGIIVVAAQQHEAIYRQTVESGSRALATNLADRLIGPLAERKTSELFFELLDLDQYPSVRYARVFDKAGALVAQYVNRKSMEVEALPPPERPGEAFGIAQIGRESHSLTPIAGAENPLGSLLIVADFAGPLEASVSSFVARTVLLVAAFLALAFVLTVVLVRRALRPLSSLSHVARQITETADLSARTNISGLDEIGTVARSFDQMLDFVDEASRERDHMLAELQSRGDDLTRAVDQLEDANRELEKLANFDELTSIPNRSLCRDRIGTALARAKRHGTAVAVLFLDLDQFKVVNDSMGHDVGDELLVAVSRRILGVLREEDTLARLGGDEFVVVAEELSGEDGAVALAQRIIAGLKNLHIRRWNITAATSIGIALAPRDADTAEGLMQHADAAMYLAKELGGGSYAVFREDLRDRMLRRLNLAMDLRKAIERGEFEIHYQPKIEVASRRLVGFEGLLRWHRGGTEMILPNEFIPIAESSGVISDLSLWIFEQGAREICELRDRWPQMDLCVAFNLSFVDLQGERFITGIERLVDAGVVDPAWIEIELTETTLMEDSASAERRLQSLADMGFKLALDDFGTGYSALSYLTRIPLKLLKIDKSFVDRALESAEARAVVRSVITLCRDLGLKVCAEGVETRDQEQFLRASGVDYLQGYRFGKPAPLAEVRAALEASDGVVELADA